MQTLSGNNTEGRLGPFGKVIEMVFRIGIPAGLIFLGMKLFNFVSPDIIEFFKNLWVIVPTATVTFLIGLYIFQNPMFLWMGYKTLCRKMTSFFIKMDPLSFMDRYIDILLEKRKKLQENKKNLSSKKIELERLMNTLAKDFNEKMRLARASKGTDDEQASHLAGLAAGDKESVDLYKPIFDRIARNLDFLDKLDANWGRSIEKLQATVERKRTEYKTLKVMAAALNMAESEFIKGDSEAARVYRESVIALEENVTSKLAYIDEFEKSSKDVMKGIDIEKKMMDEDGLSMLDQWENNQSLLLPQEEWSTPITLSSKPFNNNGPRVSTSKQSEFAKLLNK